MKEDENENQGLDSETQNHGYDQDLDGIEPEEDERYDDKIDMICWNIEALDRVKAVYEDTLFIIINRLNLKFGKNLVSAIEKHLLTHAGYDWSVALIRPEKFRRALRQILPQEKADPIEREISHALWSNTDEISFCKDTRLEL